MSSLNPNWQKFKRIRHFHAAGDCHELTFSSSSRKPLLTNDLWRKDLAESIDGALDKFEFNLSAFVFMPEHVHLLVWPRDPEEADVSGFLKRLKLSSSTKIKNRLKKRKCHLLESLTVREREGKRLFRFWQEGPGFDRNLYSVKAVLASIDYIHNNPLRRRLCERPENWYWSSYRHYLADPAFPPPPKPRWTPLPAEFLQGG